MFLSSDTSLSHQRELCPWLRLGLWWSHDVMSSEWNVTPCLGILRAWPLMGLWDWDNCRL